MPKLHKITQDEFDQTPEVDDAEDLEDSTTSYSGDYTGERYPHLAAWVSEGGWIEIGSDEYSWSAIRILDTGGLVWESDEDYESLDATLAAADAVLAELEADGEI
jgi:hypothetical protein